MSTIYAIGVCPWVRDVSKFPKFLRGVSLFVELGLRAHRRLNDLHGWRSIWTATYRASFIGNAKSVIPKPLCVLARSSVCGVQRVIGCSIITYMIESCKN